MSWTASVDGARKLCPEFAPAPPALGYDAAHSYPTGGARYWPGAPPKHVLIQHLTELGEWTPEFIEFLFIDLTQYRTAKFRTLLDDLLAQMTTGRPSYPTASSAWMPYMGDTLGGVEMRTYAQAPERPYDLYMSLVLRMALLEKMCGVLRRVTALPTQCTTAKYSSVADGTGTDADLFAHYFHQYMDSHLLLCCCINALGHAPRDDSDDLRLFMRHYAPSERTMFHEGELPDVSWHVDKCSFFGAKLTEQDNPLVRSLSKCIPQRNNVRDAMKIIVQYCRTDREFLYFLQTALAASLLGIYRHARARPSLHGRLSLYEFFFFTPPAQIRSAFLRAARTRGVREHTHRQQFQRRWGIKPDHSRDAAAKLPALQSLSGIEAMRSQELLVWMERRTSTGKYLNDAVVVNVLREFMVHSLLLAVPIHAQICLQVDWRGWQQTVFSCVDMMRGAVVSTQIPFQNVASTIDAKQSNDYRPPDDSLYVVQRKQFLNVLVDYCNVYMDRLGGSDRQIDAVFTTEMEMALRRTIFHSNYQPGMDLTPTVQIPPLDKELADLPRYYARNLFPLRLFYASSDVIRQYNAARKNFQTNSSERSVHGFVVFLSMISMYQLQLVHAFAQACIDRLHIVAIPLPSHLAAAQIAAARVRFSTPTTEPVPRHLLTSLLCIQCRRFCGHVAGPADDNAFPSSFQYACGSQLAVIANDSLEHLMTRTRADRGGRLPTYRELPTGQRLFDYYASEAVDTSSRSCYPADPSVFDALPSAIHEAERHPAVASGSLYASVDFAECTVDGPHPVLAAPGPTVRSRGVMQMLNIAHAEQELHFEEEFQRRWNEATGGHMVTGQRAHTAPDQRSIVWVCGSKRVKSEERKTRNTHVSETRIMEACTGTEVEVAKNTAERKRRQDMRQYYRYSLCQRMRLTEVNMLTFALRIDAITYVACCACLSFTTMARIHWHGAIFVCDTCHSRADTSGVVPVLRKTAIQCRRCKSNNHGQSMYAIVVWNDLNVGDERFVEVHFCDKHIREVAWAMQSPGYLPLSAIDTKNVAKMKTLGVSDPVEDYLRNYSDTNFGDDELDEIPLFDDITTAMIDKVATSTSKKAMLPPSK